MMTNHRRPFEALKYSILEDTGPEDAELVRTAISERISLLRTEANDNSRSVESKHQEERWSYGRGRYHQYNIDYMFGEITLPVRMPDVLGYLYDKGYDNGEAYALWSRLIYPDRDVSARYTNHERALEDIYPVGLLEYERTKDGNNKYEIWDSVKGRRRKVPVVTALIASSTATLDACSLKTYLAWLTDREQEFSDKLSQHLTADEVILWNEFITHLEGVMGETLQVNELAFAYFDSASEYLLYRDKGIRKFANELLRLAYRERGKINSPEQYALEFPEPETPLQICDGIWYFPAETISEHPEKVITISDLLEAAARVGSPKNTTLTLFTYLVNHMIKDSSVSVYGAQKYISIGAFNIQNKAWDKTKLGIEADQLFFVLEDGPRIEGIGKTSKKIIKSALVAAGLMDFDPTTIRYTRKADDLADKAEINTDDPSLQNIVEVILQPQPEW